MSHPLPALALVVAAPLLGLALHVASTHATGSPATRAAATLPNNLCASCHGGGRAGSSVAMLDAHDLVATRTYLQDTPRT